MKHLYLLVFLITFSNTSNSQSSYTNSRGDTHLWGVHNPAALQEEPFIKWHKKSIEDFEPDLSLFQKLDDLVDMDVTIYIGTWCGDTKNWVPKFLTLWEEIGQPLERIQLIAVHNDSDKYKQGPTGEEKNKNIHRVPTFIFEKEGKEVARIVERPTTSLEIDLAQIDRGVPPVSRYQAVKYLDEYFSENDSGFYDHDLEKIARKIYRLVRGPGELNTYGYVLSSAGHHHEAQFVFLLNTELFEYEPNCFDSLGEFYMEIDSLEQAKDCFKRVLDLDSDNDRAITMLYKINENLKKE